MSFLRSTRGGCELSVRVQPGASRSEAVGLYGEELKVRIKAPPVDGKANEALLEFLSRSLRVRRSQCLIVRGEKSRSKTVLIQGVDESLAYAALTGMMTKPAPIVP